VGIGLLSTFRDWKSVNTSHLMNEWAATAPEYWGLRPEGRVCEPTGGRLPMAGSVGPKAGPTFLVVGDAAGTVNPFNGEGIDYAYETGRLAADVLDEALQTGSGLALQRYPATLEREFALYYKVARLFVQLIGRRVFRFPIAPGAPMPGRAKAFAAGSIALWAGAITAGRLLAYTYTRLTAIP